MTAPSTSARQAAVDAANAVTTISRPHLEAILNRFTDALAGDLFIADRGDGMPAVFDPSRPEGAQCIIGPDSVSERVWALLEAILPTRDEREA